MTYRIFWTNIILLVSFLSFLPSTTYSFEKIDFLLQIGPSIDGSKKNKLKEPSDMVVSDDGTIYVTDTKNHRVVSFDSEGKLLATFGKKGDDGGEFKYPWGIDISKDGRIYVADNGNDRVQVFDKKGSFLFSFGDSGDERGEFDEPRGLRIDSQNRVIVADSDNSSICFYTLDGLFIDRFGSEGEGLGQFKVPTGIAIDSQDNIYVSDEKNVKIQVFDYAMQPLMYYERKDKKDKAFGLPVGIEVDRFGYILYADNLNGKIQQIDPSGAISTPFGSPGKGRGQFKGLKSIYFDERTDRLYAADSQNGRIQVFEVTLNKGLSKLSLANNRLQIVLNEALQHRVDDMAITESGDIYVIDSKKGGITHLTEGGTVLKKKFGFNEKGKKLISRPESIVASNSGTLYISDSSKSKVHAFDGEGKKLFEFGKNGAKDGYFKSPQGVASVGEKLVVADSGNHRIQIFNKDGIFLGKFGKKGKSKGELSKPLDVAINSKGEIWVVDSGNNRLQLFDLKGKYLDEFGGKGTGHGRFIKPRSISIDKDDNLYVIDGKKGTRVQAFDTSGKFLYVFGSPGKNSNQMMDASSLFADSRNGTKLYIMDPVKEHIQRVAIKQVPSTPKALTITNDEKGAILNWKTNGYSFQKGYKVYVKKKGEVDSISIGESIEGRFHIDYSLLEKGNVYSISAISYGNLESPLSKPVTDYYRIGYKKYVEGNYEEAVDIFKQADKGDIPNGKVLLLLGKSYIALKKAKEAEGIFRRLASIEGFELEGRFGLGESFLADGKSDKALKLFNKLLKEDPSNIRAKRFVGEIYYKGGLYQAALKTLKEATDEGLKDEGAFEMLGKIYLKSKLLGKAMTSYEAALKINPRSPSLHRGLAGVYEADGKIDEAIVEYKKALSFDLKDEETSVKLAGLYIKEKRLAEAEEIIKRIIEQFPENIEVLHIDGQISMFGGRHEDAIITFRNVLATKEDHHGALLNLSRAYVEIGQEGEAIKALEKLVKFNPKSADVLLALGNLNKKSGNKDMAISNYEACISADTDAIDCYKEISAIYQEDGEVEKSVTPLSEIVRLSPKDAGAKVALAKAFKHLDKTGEAIVHLENAVKIDGENSEARYELGTIFAQNKQTTKAMGYLKMAVSLSPDIADYHNALGLVYLNQVRVDGAIKSFKEANSLEEREEFKRNLNEAYERKKELLASSEKAPPLEITEIEFGKAFSSIYKSYADNSIGRITIRNNSDEVFRKIKVHIYVLKYMDFPTEKVVEELRPHGVAVIDVMPTFNNQLLKITEDISAQAEVSINYFHEKKEKSTTRTNPINIYNRNAMTWANKEMVSAFITPKDEPVVGFARAIVQMFHDKGGLIDEKMTKAMQLFDAMGAMGIVYQIDPNNPYESSSIDYEKVDSVQYPRDTLKHKSGDCDDLSILYSALLENIGIETVLLDVPGHLFMAFKTDAKEGEGEKIATSSDLYFVRNGHIWIPVEATMVGKAFAEAWYEGAKEVRKREAESALKYIDTHLAWKSYKPVTLEQVQEVTIPEKEQILAILEKDISLQKKKGIEKLARIFLDELEKNPEDYEARLNLAIIYGKNGFYDDAIKELESILATVPDDAATLNNMGNLYFTREEYEKALDLYNRASQSENSDAGIVMNMALAQYKIGNLEEAKKMFKESEKLSQEKAAEFSLLRSLLFD